MRVTTTLFTLLLHFSCSLFCGLYLTGGLQIGFYHHLPPPRPPELYPRRCLWGGWQDVRPTRRSKSHCDLFNSYRVNITDACKAGITVAELDVLRRDSGSVSFLLRFTHTRIRARFSVMDNHPRDVASQ